MRVLPILHASTMAIVHERTMPLGGCGVERGCVVVEQILKSYEVRSNTRFIREK